jgi:hypothetical protein
MRPKKQTEAVEQKRAEVRAEKYLSRYTPPAPKESAMQPIRSADTYEAIQEKNLRLRYLCEQAGIDTSVVDNDSVWPSDQFNSPGIGDIAYVAEPDYTKTIQIIDRSNMICELNLHSYATKQIDRGPARGITLESRTARWTGDESSYTTKELVYKKYVVWIKGVDSTGKVDDQKISIETPLRVTSTTQYDSIDGGTRTIMVMEPAELPKVKFLKKDKPKQELTESSAPAPPSVFPVSRP